MADRAHPGPTARVRAVLVSGPFVACLAALLLNDRWLKHAWPGAISGKLSDFAGIAVVGMLLAAALPRHRLSTALVISVGFAWWKSPLSQPVIEWVSSASGSRYSRVVDYSDLAALVVLPLCGRAADRACVLDLDAFRKIASVPLGVLAALAIMATSQVMAQRDYAVRPVNAGAPIDAVAVKRVIDEVATAHGMKWTAARYPYDSDHYEGYGLWLRYRVDDTRGVSIKISAVTNGLFFGTDREKRADALREALNNALAEAVPGLEYVEPLKAKPPPPAPCVPSPVPTPPCRR